MSTARYCKEWRLDTARNGPRRVPIEPAAERVRHLTSLGYSHQQIAVAAGVSRSLITALANGTSQTTNRDHASRILAADLSTTVPGELAFVDATGTRRRLQALIAIGHPLINIANATGHLSWNLGRITSGHYQVVRPNTAKSIARLYRAWATTPGTCNRSRRRAQQAGWVGPLAWDATDIDNPAAEPEPEPENPVLNKSQLAELRLTEIRHLAAYGTPANEIATRIGVSVKHVTAVVAYETGRWKKAA